MSENVNVVWKKGDGGMPSKAKHVVDAARSEMLLRSLQLPEDTVNVILYNSDKNEQTVPEYIASILVQQLRTA
jgi:hypothetical protein